ncbi:MAG: DNA repair protein RecO [Patescibacteria group bacterium]
MPLFRTEAIILNRKNFRVNDRIFLVYGKNEGKLELLARGARKKESKLAGALEPYALAELMVAGGRSFDYITAVKVLKYYHNIRNDLTVIAWLAVIVEITGQHIKPQSREGEIFELLKETLEILEKARETSKKIQLIIAAIFKLIKTLGFIPQLYSCQECQSKIKPVRNNFSLAKAGLLCPQCLKVDKESHPVSTEAIKILRFFLEQDLKKAAALKLEKKEIEELKKVIFPYLKYIFEHDFKSLSYLKQMPDG